MDKDKNFEKWMRQIIQYLEHIEKLLQQMPVYFPLLFGQKLNKFKFDTADAIVLITGNNSMYNLLKQIIFPSYSGY